MTMVINDAITVTQANIEKVSEAFTRMEKALMYLFDRWQDEKEYEDIQEYRDALIPQLPEGAAQVKLTGSPFALKFKMEGSSGLFTIRVTKTRATLTYQ